MALTGFLVNMGHSTTCAKDAVDAMIALGARFPYVAGSQPVLCNLDSSTFTAPNTFTNAVTCHDLTGNAAWTYSHPLKLAQCDPLVWNVDLASVFNLPVSPDLTTVWMLGFTLPLILWLTAWGFGVVVNMFQDDK